MTSKSKTRHSSLRSKVWLSLTYIHTHSDKHARVWQFELPQTSSAHSPWSRSSHSGTSRAASSSQLAGRRGCCSLRASQTSARSSSFDSLSQRPQVRSTCERPFRSNTSISSINVNGDMIERVLLRRDPRHDLLLEGPPLLPQVFIERHHLQEADPRARSGGGGKHSSHSPIHTSFSSPYVEWWFLLGHSLDGEGGPKAWSAHVSRITRSRERPDHLRDIQGHPSRAL